MNDSPLRATLPRCDGSLGVSSDAGPVMASKGASISGPLKMYTWLFAAVV